MKSVWSVVFHPGQKSSCECNRVASLRAIFQRDGRPLTTLTRLTRWAASGSLRVP